MPTVAWPLSLLHPARACKSLYDLLHPIGGRAPSFPAPGGARGRPRLPGTGLAQRQPAFLGSRLPTLHGLLTHALSPFTHTHTHRVVHNTRSHPPANEIFLKSQLCHYPALKHFLIILKTTPKSPGLCEAHQDLPCPPVRARRP